jgi:hypothetical protein
LRPQVNDALERSLYGATIILIFRLEETRKHELLGERYFIDLDCQNDQSLPRSLAVAALAFCGVTSHLLNHVRDFDLQRPLGPHPRAPAHPRAPRSAPACTAARSIERRRQERAQLAQADAALRAQLKDERRPVRHRGCPPRIAP